MKTLDEIFPSGRGDGRKFRRTGEAWDMRFEPIFKGRTQWVGLDAGGHTVEVAHGEFQWTEWQPPKKTKKVTLYRPVIKTSLGNYTIPYCWSSFKDLSVNNNIVGWQEMEVEIDE